MRYGIDDSENRTSDRTVFPVQSSVLDEKALLSEVVKDYAVPEPFSCRFLSRGDADIYRLKTAAGNFYLKIYRPPKSLDLAEAEACFVWALAEAKVPVVKPVPRLDGQFAFVLTAPEGNRPLLLYEEAPPALPSELDEELAATIGEKTALVHNAADDFGTSFGLAEIEVNILLDEMVSFIKQFLSENESRYLEDVSKHLKAIFEKQPRNTPEYGLCHADLVLSNIRLSKEGVVTLFDFGNALKTWRTFELAVLYESLGHRYNEDREGLWNAILRGYQSIRPLPKTLKDLPVMLILRQMSFLGGNCATLPLRLGTELFETGFVEKEMKRLRALVEAYG